MNKNNLKNDNNLIGFGYFVASSFITKLFSVSNIVQFTKVLCFKTSFALMLFLSACGQSSAYDVSKAPLLTEEKRRVMDIMLANELETYNTNTERCKGDPNKPSAVGECRVAFFKQLAEEGYEIADIADKIFDPLRGDIRKDRAAYERLRQLADAGDKSALCFAPRIFIHHLSYEGWPYTIETEMRYNKLGAAQGLPLCLLNEALFYREGTNGFPMDLKMTHKLALDAATEGLYLAQYLLLIDYEKSIGITKADYRYKNSDLPTIRKALCWGRLASMHSSWSLFYSFTNDLVTASRDKQDRSKLIHPELEQLADDWDLRYTSYEKRPTTPNDCLKIEKEN